MGLSKRGNAIISSVQVINNVHISHLWSTKMTSNVTVYSSSFNDMGRVLPLHV
ncbi:hypothetical protein PAHAL_7G062200 [Panicum hallii]|uniref:Uncharacterized protein n=1 Tax=Panicum hallii TaxID=206008 RepID=A0A2T8IB42_9POAL|nr:hypothetical protein PAHAL_7G062200 [Panicum hallii]